MAQPRELRIPVDGGDLAVFEWPGADPPVLFVHATGFHARCWDQVIAQLPGQHCYAVDMRGHGRSHKPPPPYPWRRFADDLVVLGRALGLHGAIAAGHSMGGHSVTYAAALDPALFAGLLLIDPVIMPREFYVGLWAGEHFAARRRDRWASPDEMYERFKSRSPFDRWDLAVLRDYCDYGLLRAEDGDGFVLACPPVIEASVYQHSTAANIYPELAKIDLPVRLLRAGRPAARPFDMEGSPTAPDLAQFFRRCDDTALAEHSHFIPMEAPDLVAACVLDLLNVVSRQ